MQGGPAISISGVDVGLGWQKILDNGQVAVESGLVKGCFALLVFQVSHRTPRFNAPDDDVEIAATGCSVESGEAGAGRSVI